MERREAAYAPLRLLYWTGDRCHAVTVFTFIYSWRESGDRGQQEIDVLLSEDDDFNFPVYQQSPLASHTCRKHKQRTTACVVMWRRPFKSATWKQHGGELKHWETCPVYRLDTFWFLWRRRRTEIKCKHGKNVSVTKGNTTNLFQHNHVTKYEQCTAQKTKMTGKVPPQSSSQ